ncbi:MAG: UDP-N-acetylmuramoyl-L-alanyl-D-glutamate--2,6-diaminopimelate ligase [Clostridiales bacterium]|jgi:UDP-N-acetylmuramyl-tripeptide synthetase|nr:UDP-N-acetylmuramoyl-L-alanyl-D-glutamate--2,6-diaminopimelate ligase [Clostridiales bacterium]
MQISELLHNVNVIKIEGNNREISELSYNTATVGKDSLFFCIPGIKTDGHLFANNAINSGASALVISKEVDASGDVTLIKVEDTRKAMAQISSNFYGNPSNSMSIVGITGTNGKTTSSFMLKSILNESGIKTGLMGTIYNIFDDEVEVAKRTTPESMDLQKKLSRMHHKGVEECIMEVSSHSLALDRVFGIKFKVGIFTNLTQDHLDFHLNMENYFRAKMKLFESCENAVINIDDEYGKRISEEVQCNIITYGIEKKADVFAEDVIISGEGTSFTLGYKNEIHPVNLHLPGKFNVYNALGCAATAIALGIPLNFIVKGLEALEKVPGRSEKINSKRGFTIVIDYAHSPDGILNILKTAREYTNNRLITLFGCGGDRDKSKRPLMGKAAGSLSDFCIVTSDNPRTEEPMDIINDILPGIDQTNCSYVIIKDRKKAIENALKMGQPGDVIVIAGKGHETYQVLKSETIHFDEREIVHELLKEEA